MLDLSKAIRNTMDKAGITDADILKHPRIWAEQSKDVCVNGTTLSDLKADFADLPQDAHIEDVTDWNYSSIPNWKIIWTALETDEQYARRVMQEIKQKEAVKKCKATKAAKEKTVYERLKKKYG